MTTTIQRSGVVGPCTIGAGIAGRNASAGVLMVLIELDAASTVARAAANRCRR